MLLRIKLRFKNKYTSKSAFEMVGSCNVGQLIDGVSPHEEDTVFIGVRGFEVVAGEIDAELLESVLLFKVDAIISLIIYSPIKYFNFK
jgi:hypothetical protein